MIKEIFCALTPPIIQSTLKNTFLKKNGYFSGPYANWQKALQTATGYEDSVVLEKVRNATLEVKNNAKLFVRDGVVFSEPQYSFPLLAALSKIALGNEKSITVLDFGGGLGTSYFSLKNFCKDIKVKWYIVEQAAYVNCGNELFRNEELSFYHTLEEISELPEVVLLSGVLQYIEKPYQLLANLTERKVKHIIVDRTLFDNAQQDLLLIEHVPKHIYDGCYPCWLFSYSKMMDYFRSNYQVVYEFSAIEGKFSMNGFNIGSRGIFLERKD